MDEAKRRISSFPEKLDSVIKESGLTKQEFADRLGRNRNTILNYLNGREPKLDFLVAIVLELSLEDDISWLLGLKNERGETQPSVESVVSQTLKLSKEEQLRVLRVLNSLHV